MYRQVYDPVSSSLGWSSLVAVLPLVALFVLLGGLKIAAQWAAIVALAVSLIVAIGVYDMPTGQAFDSAASGALFGLWPIMWIVVNAIWIYKLTVKTGHFAALRQSISGISADERIQAILVAFSFGALLEALAGFGTPVAITSVMLIALGFQPIKAAALALVANTAPVAFGAIATPITALAKVTELDKQDLGSMVGRQTPFLALIVPLILAYMVDGRRGLRETWPAALTGGAVFALGQWITSNYISVELTDVVASLASIAAIVLFLQVWSPTGAPGPRVRRRPVVAGGSPEADAELERGPLAGVDRQFSRREVIEAYMPYLIIVVVFFLRQKVGPIKDQLERGITEFNWPGLDIVNADGEAVKTTFKFDYLPAVGTMLLVAGLLTMLVLRIRPLVAVRTYVETVRHLFWPIVTVASVLALAFVMNYSGQTITLGKWAAEAGGVFALLSPLIGWFGVALTGSDTSSNTLFGSLQVAAAKDAGLPQVLMAAGNSSGGVLGKMISPQNLAIGAAAVGLAGGEGDIFRKVFGWSLLLIAVMMGLVYLQSTSILSWMVP